MTIKEAAAKWGVSVSPLRKRAESGTLPGAVLVHASGFRGIGAWILPDDMPKPQDIRPRTKGSYFERRERKKALQAQLEREKALKAEQQRRVRYVWDHQRQTIAEIAKGLSISPRQVPPLFDEALEQYRKGLMHAP